MVETAAYETIRTETSGAVLTITLNRPESLNALNAAMRRELLSAIRAAGKDESVRAVVITGEGRGFCSGADLRGGPAEREFRRVVTAEYNPLISAIRELPKPVIAAVNGVAAGAGVSLALACDLVYAAEEAQFILAFVRHHAARLIFSGDPLRATDAVEAGLVNAVVPPGELADHVRVLAEGLAQGPTRAIGYAKRLINQAEQATLAESLAEEASFQELAGRTADHAEGAAAFAEKRAPRFTGR
jgi:2-(1,2-epoxy-1,2-dihydrophenyl)acetyl-CoA isomerase